MPLSHAIMSSMQFYPDDVIAYAVMSAGLFCIFFYAIVSARTLLHNASVSNDQIDFIFMHISPGSCLQLFSPVFGIVTESLADCSSRCIVLISSCIIVLYAIY